VDIEKIQRLPDESTTARYILKDVEYSVYQELSPEQATLFFFKCWTAKEAYLKLLGVGLNIEPKEIFLETNHFEPVRAQFGSFPSAQITYLSTEPLNSFIACLATYEKKDKFT
jgi:phosphopantetheinyl transferase